MEEKLEEKKADGPTWKNRRRVIISTLLFCAGVICYVLFKGGESRLYETALEMAFLLAGSVVGGYVFGATWQDVSIKKG